MKTRISYLTGTFLFVIFLSACSGGTKETVLQARIDSLEKEVAHLKHGKFFDEKEDFVTRRVDRAVAEQMTADFRDAGITDIEIPLAWNFNSEHLAELATESPNGSIRLYAGLKDESGKKVLHLLAMPITILDEGDDIFTNNLGKSNIYDFAAPCPTKCDQNNSTMLPANPAEIVVQKFKRN